MRLIFLLASLTFSGFTIASTINIECTYDRIATAKAFSKLDKPIIETFILNTATNKAFKVEDSKKIEVHYIPSETHELMTFLQITESQTVNVTSYSTYQKSAVKSSNLAFLGELIATQIYGTCKIK